MTVALANTLDKLEAEKHVETLGDLESESLDYKPVGRVKVYFDTLLNMRGDALVDTLADVPPDAKAKTLVDTLADTVAELEAERDYAKRRAKHWWTCSLKGQPKKKARHCSKCFVFQTLDVALGDEEGKTLSRHAG